MPEVVFEQPKERNSEGKMTWIMVVAAVIVALGAAGGALLTSGILDPWPWAATAIGALVSIAKVVGDYTKSRPAKHAALATRGPAGGIKLDPPKLPE